jgi:uncharacterized RDD family membrane protein YckC
MNRYDAHETDRMRALHGCQLASFQRRVAAFLLDLLVGAILFFALFVAIAYIRNGSITFHVSGIRVSGMEHAPDPGAANRDVNVRLTFFENGAGILWWVLYFGLGTYAGKGRTPGKWLMNIRVVSLVHDRLTLWQSVERALGYGASALEFGFGFAQYFVHPNRRTVHDRIAETIVVAEPSVQCAGEPARVAV